MTTATFVPADEIRARFASAMSAMYRKEVPLYGDLLDIVADVNARVLANTPALADAHGRSGELSRIAAERHGAIRVGTAQELSLMRRAFAVLGMYPVGYYDLSAAGVPVHSTAFRPVDEQALAASPFRIFTSLLRLELIEDEALRGEAEAILADRRIATERAVELIEQAEKQGGLREDAADAFVSELLETFRWHDRARVDAATYARLSDAHRLIADVVSFRGPHINHLTPRTLDIDAAQEEMRLRGIGAKAVIEGPPPRQVPLLLRQTSFRAIEEEIVFDDGENGAPGRHTARFGEIEQRGAALTPKGRALYDQLLSRARDTDDAQELDYERRLAAAFADFPDTPDALRREQLAYFRYSLTDEGRNRIAARDGALRDIDALLEGGWVLAEPITYEDFLPVSAAGIFQSNLGGERQATYSAASAKAAFEGALGVAVLDEFALYEHVERASLASVREALDAS